MEMTTDTRWDMDEQREVRYKGSDVWDRASKALCNAAKSWEKYKGLPGYGNITMCHGGCFGKGWQGNSPWGTKGRGRPVKAK